MATHPAKKKVIIVGAGMAGLAAAMELQRSGQCDVTVLEATGRAGGRIHSVEGFASRVIELGANWIHGTKGNPVYKLAATHRLLWEDSEPTVAAVSVDQKCSWLYNGQENDNHYQMESGERVHPELAKEAKLIYTTVMERLEERDAEQWDPALNVDGFMRSGFATELKERGIGAGDDPERHRQFWLMFEYFCRMEAMDIGSDALQEVQLRSFCLYEELEGDYYTSLGSGGYQAVISKMLEEIPAASIHYHAAAAKIRYAARESDWNGEEQAYVRVECEDGRTFVGRHLIMTASVGFLKENMDTLFEPALPAKVQRSLQTMPSGTVNKIFLKYDKPFWTADEFGVQILWEAPVAGETMDEEVEKEKFYRMLCGFDVEDHNYRDVLVGWIYSRGAEYMETLSDEEVGQRCTMILRKFLNNPSIPQPDKVLCTRWHSNKYQRGAYGAFLPMHSTGNEFRIMSNPICLMRERGRKNIPVLLFAGEAFHQEYYSTTHGAMLSGRNQAKVLLRCWSKE